MNLYRFSPIENKEQLFKAVAYVASEVLRLIETTTSNAYPISYLTIFTHYREEYEKLISILPDLGKVSDANNGLQVELDKPVNKINRLRIRKPDPYRMQVGCADLNVGDYNTFKEKYLSSSTNLRLIERLEYEMIEFFNPDFDVLAYSVSTG